MGSKYDDKLGRNETKLTGPILVLQVNPQNLVLYLLCKTTLQIRHETRYVFHTWFEQNAIDGSHRGHLMQDEEQNNET
jgi:hypothetical protein